MCRSGRRQSQGCSWEWGDLVWIIRREPKLPDIKLIGEYQGEAFHSRPEQRAYDRVRRKGFNRDGWGVEFIWNTDRTTSESRRLTVVRFATALEMKADSLNLAAREPRFFSSYAMQLAEQRNARRYHAHLVSKPR
jgi:hypothetical protein